MAKIVKLSDYRSIVGEASLEAASEEASTPAHSGSKPECFGTDRDTLSEGDKEQCWPCQHFVECIETAFRRRFEAMLASNAEASPAAATRPPTQ